MAELIIKMAWIVRRERDATFDKSLSLGTITGSIERKIVEFTDEGKVE